MKDKVVSLQKLVETLQKSEEEAAISAAETKQSIYLELESKEAQVKNLKETLAKALQEKARLSDKGKILNIFYTCRTAWTHPSFSPLFKEARGKFNHSMIKSNVN